MPDAAAGPATPGGNGPNLLFLFSDQHAQRVAGCYGDAVVETPHLDRLSQEGVTFDNCYTPSPICVPARMSMLTGLHPHEQRCWTNDDILPSDIPTWPQAMGAGKIHTALIGRMHALGPDQLRGYAEREIGDHSPNWPGLLRHDLGTLHNANDPHRVGIDNSGPGQSAYQVLDEATADAAAAWLRRWAAGDHKRKASSRFALTVGFMLPHAPFVCWPDDFARYTGRVPPPANSPAEDEHPWLHWWRQSRGIADVPAATIDRARTAYWGLVTHLDRLIGRVLAALDETGLAENTIVVYTSDHGEQAGERGLWWKHTFYDHSAKVPLIVRWPGRLPAGERRANVVTLQDVAATMLDLMDAPALPRSRGRSFADTALRGHGPWTDLAFSEYCTDAVPDWTGGMAVRQRMVRLGRWKLIDYHGYPPQLFDLEVDPGETKDLAAVPSCRSVREQLIRLVRSDWDPDRIETEMAMRRREKDIQAAWARFVAPPDSIRFQATPDMNRLERSEA